METVIKSTEQSCTDTTTDDVSLSPTTDNNNHEVTAHSSPSALNSACTDAFQMYRFSLLTVLRNCSVCSLRLQLQQQQ